MRWLYQAGAVPAAPVETIVLDKWFRPLAEPSRRPAPTAALAMSFGLAALPPATGPFAGLLAGQWTGFGLSVEMVPY
jgi:hypothetical protein